MASTERNDFLKNQRTREVWLRSFKHISADSLFGKSTKFLFWGKARPFLLITEVPDLFFKIGYIILIYCN